MLFLPSEVRPVSEEVRAGLVLSRVGYEETGTLRQGRAEYRLLRDLWYTDPRTGKTYRVERGFVSDIHSLPRLLRPWQPRNPCWWSPAFFHDRLLEGGEVSIREANRVYLHIMQDLGVRWPHRFVAFAGVEFARFAFPDRITCIDPDNAELIARVSGRQAVQDETGPAIRKAIFMAVRAAAGGYLKSRGVPLP
ncbi:DUF1353 domain-containing protein [Hyphomonas pacifica]|uniref:DUF1353 domain-containing protein n=1 Tax=Hyphomonas pacifica TaxID=1280941 RepID=A0A8B2PJK1_9PROT|nr:DUF1353 domain-containing protein [Hyphomonas pacifica]RAN30618.1 hypothetical protein HY3_05570 [Hyphomonas pacifica]